MRPSIPRASDSQQNGRVTDVRHVLVLPDRDAAEAVAAELTERLGLPEEPRPLREALAGEDDAEDAQWLVVLDDPAGVRDRAELAALAEEYEGWLEDVG
jgi:hypothetical protein